MSNSELENCLLKCIEKNKAIISDLHDLIEQVEGHKKTCTAVKTGGVAATAAGAGILIGSILLAPVTGGLSLALGIGGTALSVGGSATGIATDVFDRNKSKKIISNIDSLVKTREDTISALQKPIDQFSKGVQHIVSKGFDEETAIHLALKGIANKSIDFDDFTKNDAMLRTYVKISRASASNASFLAKTILGTTGTDVKIIGSILGISSTAAVSTLKVISNVTMIASIAFTVVDVGVLIRDWGSKHPTVKVIEDVIQQLEEENEKFEHMHNLIDSYKERIFVASMENITIIANQEEFIQVIISLLNRQISTCNEILQKNALNSPFQIHITSDEEAKFLNEKNIAKGLDPNELVALIDKSDKQCRPVIRLKIEDILKEMKITSSQSKHLKHQHREHIINNDVISIYQDIINLFTMHQFAKKFDQLTFISSTTQIYTDYHNPWPSNVRENIQEVLISVVDQCYLDANACAYSIIVQMLYEVAKCHMIELYNNENMQYTTSSYTDKVEFLTNTINEFQLYVDQVTLQVWLANSGDITVYREACLEVHKLFINLYLKLNDWTEEMKQYSQ